MPRDNCVVLYVCHRKSPWLDHVVIRATRKRNGLIFCVLLSASRVDDKFAALGPESSAVQSNATTRATMQSMPRCS